MIAIKPILLIWDIDGTLMNSKGIGRRAMDKTFKGLYDIENGFDKVAMSGRLDYQIIKNAHMHHKIDLYNVEQFYSAYEEELKKEIKDDNMAEVIPGIREILDNKNKDIYHIIGTGNCEIGAKLKLKHVGLEHYFTIGGYGDADVDRWEIIKKAYEEARAYYNINFDDQHTYVIGDTPYDVECAKKLGFKSIAVSTGSHSIEELKNCESTYLVKGLDVNTLNNILNDG